MDGRKDASDYRRGEKAVKMQRLVLVSKLGFPLAKLPHKVYISGRFVGVMQQPSVAIDIYPGVYLVRIQSMVPFFSAATTVQVRAGADTVLSFKDRESLWDILFVVDLVLWCAKFFFPLPLVWTWIYEIFTNGFFVAWLGYEWYIRKKYFKLTIE